MTTPIDREAEHTAEALRTSHSLHVWTIALDVSPPTEHPEEWLSAEERARASRYRFEADRRRFVAARTALRAILARYLCVPPASVIFTTGSWGKPMLDGARHGTTLRFNLSHSHELALVVVAHDRDVGVDVERVRMLPELDGIVARAFSADERMTLERLPPERRLHAFFKSWTAKEAYLKACGQGLRREPRHIEVQGSCDDERPKIRVLDPPDDRHRSEVFWIMPRAEYAAAIAVELAGVPAPHSQPAPKMKVATAGSVAPTGYDRTYRIQVRDFIAR
jgi:4'-phosphopantetheinyl transferase